MQLSITHRTTYRFDKPVPYGLQQLRLTPKSRDTQKVLHWRTHLDGAELQLSFADSHANHVDVISFSGMPHDVIITGEGMIETTDHAGVVGKHQGFMPLWCFERSTPRTRTGPAIRALAAKADGKDEVTRMHALMNAIADAVSYEVGATTAETTAEEAAAAGHGVCQDHAHIMIAAARHLGLPARYVSGYLMMNDRIDQDASHAWAEVHVPTLGWVGFDPSNRISPDARYVRVATGLDYAGAAPVTGLRFGDAQEEVLVSLQVQQ